MVDRGYYFRPVDSDPLPPPPAHQRGAYHFRNDGGGWYGGDGDNRRNMPVRLVPANSGAASGVWAPTSTPYRAPTVSAQIDDENYYNTKTLEQYLQAQALARGHGGAGGGLNPACTCGKHHGTGAAAAPQQQATASSTPMFTQPLVVVNNNTTAPPSPAASEPTGASMRMASETDGGGIGGGEGQMLVMLRIMDEMFNKMSDAYMRGRRDATAQVNTILWLLLVVIGLLAIGLLLALLTRQSQSQQPLYVWTDKPPPARN